VRDRGCQQLAYVYFKDEPGGDRRQGLWGLPRRTWAIDHLLYEINSGFWRWVTGNPVSIDGVNPRFPGLGKLLPSPFLMRADSETLIEHYLAHSCFPSAKLPTKAEARPVLQPRQVRAQVQAFLARRDAAGARLITREVRMLDRPRSRIST
jgi:hypothetical protein